MSNKYRRFSLGKLFSNNKFVAVFSLVLSFSLWLWISIEKSPVIEKTILSVPVNINLEDSIPSKLGLQVFGNDNYTVDVTVKGKKFVVSSLSANDISVYAQTNYVDSSGTKTLLLKTEVLNGKDFEITSLSQTYIQVYFDSLKEVEFAIEPKIDSNVEKLVSDGCILGDAVLSNSTVTLQGPATEINKITGVEAKYTIEQTLENTTTVTPEIKMIGASESDLSNTKIVNDTSVITMTLPVLKEVILPTTVSFKNVPAKYLDGAFSKSVYPTTARVAVPIEKIDQIKEITVGTIDFNEINVGNNNFKFNSNDISDYVFTTEKKFSVTVSVPDVEAATFTIQKENITLDGTVDGYSFKLVSNSIDDVKVIGPSPELSNIKSEGIIAKINIKSLTVTEGKMTVPAIISVGDNTECWAYGDYTVEIEAIKK